MPDTLYENFNPSIPTGDTTDIFDVKWRGQSFTTHAAHKITSADIACYKAGTISGNLTLLLYAASSNSSGATPTGSALASGTLAVSGITTNTNGAVYNIVFGTPVKLASSTRYILMWHLDSGVGSAGNEVIPMQKNATYTGLGARVFSQDGGSTWSADADGTGESLYFSEYGLALNQGNMFLVM